MYGVNLFRLARLVGLKRIDIARHLGVVRMQATYWGQGKRPIPGDRIAPLVALIAKAVQTRLATAAPWDQVRADLTTALQDCFLENCQRYVPMPEPSLEAFMAEVEQYAALTQRQQQQGPRLAHMEQLSAAMLSWFQVHAALLPLLRLLEGDDDADTVEDTTRKGMSVR
jgi:hypothetical protein